MNEINEGVRVLVERMKTNPEEFHEGYGSKWARAVSMAVNAEWLTEEERKLLDDAANEVKRQMFTAEVLKTLTSDEPQKVEYREAMRLGASGSLGIGTSPSTFTSPLYVSSTTNPGLTIQGQNTTATLTASDINKMKKLIGSAP